MNVRFGKPTENDAKDISSWKYDGIFSFYDNDKTEAKKNWASNIYNEDNTFSIYNDKSELIGNCCFDYDADDKLYTFGVQMRPSLTGKGLGREVVEAILSFGRETYQFNEIGLLVAKFNKRAIKVYEKLGFNIIEEFIWNVNDEEKEFVSMKKKL